MHLQNYLNLEDLDFLKQRLLSSQFTFFPKLPFLSDSQSDQALGAAHKASKTNKQKECFLPLLYYFSLFWLLSRPSPSSPSSLLFREKAQVHILQLRPQRENMVIKHECPMLILQVRNLQRFNLMVCVTRRLIGESILLMQAPNLPWFKPCGA